MFGLIISEPRADHALRTALMERCGALDLPIAAITGEEASWFDDCDAGSCFFRRACSALMRPGTPIPAAPLLQLLNGEDPKPADALRRSLYLQFSLVPALRTGGTVIDLPGAHLLGPQLLVVHVSGDDHTDCLLPSGLWTDIRSLELWEGRMIRMCGINENPVLARQNALLPVGVEDRCSPLDDADRVTLHWYQPQRQAACTLADGTSFSVSMDEAGQVTVVTNAEKAWHLIVHRETEEIMVR